MHMIYFVDEKWAMAHKRTKMVYLKNRNYFEQVHLKKNHEHIMVQDS